MKKLEALLENVEVTRKLSPTPLFFRQYPIQNYLGYGAAGYDDGGSCEGVGSDYGSGCDRSGGCNCE